MAGAFAAGLPLGVENPGVNAAEAARVLIDVHITPESICA